MAVQLHSVRRYIALSTGAFLIWVKQFHRLPVNKLSISWTFFRLPDLHIKSWQCVFRFKSFAWCISVNYLSLAHYLQNPSKERMVLEISTIFFKINSVGLITTRLV